MTRLVTRLDWEKDPVAECGILTVVSGMEYHVWSDSPGVWRAGAGAEGQTRFGRQHDSALRAMDACARAAGLRAVHSAPASVVFGP